MGFNSGFKGLISESINVYVQRSPVEIQTTTCWKLIGHSRPPRHLCYHLAVSTLPPPLSH